jgi:hypothetical protein
MRELQQIAKLTLIFGWILGRRKIRDTYNLGSPDGTLPRSGADGSVRLGSEGCEPAIDIVFDQLTDSGP